MSRLSQLIRAACGRALFALVIAVNVLLVYGWWQVNGRAKAQYLTTTVIRAGGVALTEWQQGIGWNFRNTAGFVTDNTSQLYGLGYADVYPRTRTPVGYSNAVTFGRGSGSIAQSDRSNAVDPRFAGVIRRGNALSLIGGWQVDLPAAGDYEIRIAAGDTANASGCTRFQIRDTDGTTVLAECDTGTSVPQDQYQDATCVLRTEANWAATNVAQTVTISAGSPPKVWIFLGAGSCATENSNIAHLRIKQL